MVQWREWKNKISGRRGDCDRDSGFDRSREAPLPRWVVVVRGLGGLLRTGIEAVFGQFPAVAMVTVVKDVEIAARRLIYEGWVLENLCIGVKSIKGGLVFSKDSLSFLDLAGVCLQASPSTIARIASISAITTAVGGNEALTSTSNLLFVSPSRAESHSPSNHGNVAPSPLSPLPLMVVDSQTLEIILL
ncbi:hypothetical protein VNO77_33931 [Canavalia gladiata]|uniref:Uncharacterized protein n=1 Tax=Canavalia gladiata TaxID=3824 RepID=A0AAN9KCS0_CANGL